MKAKEHDHGKHHARQGGTNEAIECLGRQAAGILSLLHQGAHIATGDQVDQAEDEQGTGQVEPADA